MNTDGTFDSDPARPVAPPFARLVVYRHPCDCDSASRPLAPGEHAEHRFDVDDAPFPWCITEDGPSFRRLIFSNIYLVTVRVLPFLSTTLEHVSVAYHNGDLHLGGRRFPWAIASPVKLIADQRDCCTTLDLTFIASYVDADIDIPEEDI